MTLQDLHDRIVETLNLEVITETSLIVCVNNCFADFLSRGYREFEESHITEVDTTPLDQQDFPFSLDVPATFRKLQYLKVITDINTCNAERVNLSSLAYRGRLDSEGKQRISFSTLYSPYAYYVLNDKVYIDAMTGAHPIKELYLGYYKRLDKVAKDSPLTTEIPIREELEDALVLYGVYFYTNRHSIDTELSKELMNRYRYFVEDILNDLNAEDMFIASNKIEAYDIYDG